MQAVLPGDLAVGVDDRVQGDMAVRNVVRQDCGGEHDFVHGGAAHRLRSERLEPALDVAG